MGGLRKITRGSNLRNLSAGDWNAFIDTTLWARRQQWSRGDKVENTFPHPAVVEIQNNTGAALDWYNIVALGGPVYPPATYLTSYLQEPAFIGNVPASPPDINRFAVMLEPLPAGSVPFGSGSGSGTGPLLIGRAAIAGAVQAQVQVTNVNHGFAVPQAGNVVNLVSSPIGGARILDPVVALGLQWLQVELAVDAPYAFEAITTSPISAYNSPTLGAGTALVLNDVGGILVSSGVNVEVVNKFTHVVPQGTLVTLVRIGTALLIVEPDRQYREECLLGNPGLPAGTLSLARQRSDDGENTWILDKFLGCISCDSCVGTGTGSGSGGCIGCRQCPNCGLPTYCVSGLPTGFSYLPSSICTVTNPYLAESSCDWGGYVGGFTGWAVAINYLPLGGLTGPPGWYVTASDQQLPYTIFQWYLGATWDCASPVTSSMQTYGPAVGPVTVSPGSCGSGSGSGGSGGSGSGGSCSIVPVSLGTSSSAGSPLTYTVPGTVPAGYGLLVQAAAIGNAPGSLSATFNGVAMNIDETSSNSIAPPSGLPVVIKGAQLSQLQSAPVTNGSLVVTASGSSVGEILVTVEMVPCFESTDAPACVASNGKNPAQCDTGFAPNPTAQAIEYSKAMFVVTFPNGSLPAWQNGYSAGQSISATWGTYTVQLVDGDRILSSITTLDAAYSETGTMWCGSESAYKMS